MPRFNFALGKAGTLREAGEVQSDTFDDALEAIAEQAIVQVGDLLEIGVHGFPPARYTLVKTGRKSRGWKPANQLAA
ncbi:MAG: hypothetical protein ACXWZS_02965 [Gemmatirosa sp.]